MESREARGRRKNSFRPDSQAKKHWEKYLMQLKNSERYGGFLNIFEESF